MSHNEFEIMNERRHLQMDNEAFICSQLNEWLETGGSWRRELPDSGACRDGNATLQWRLVNGP